MSLFRGGGGAGSRVYGLYSVAVERLRWLGLLRCARHLQQRNDDGGLLTGRVVLIERILVNALKSYADDRYRALLLSDMVYLPGLSLSRLIGVPKRTSQ